MSAANEASASNVELERIYREANGISNGKRAPLTTEAVFAAMRAAIEIERERWRLKLEEAAVQRLQAENEQLRVQGALLQGKINGANERACYAEFDSKRLDWLEAHPACEISYGGWDEEGDPWVVHEVAGGRNDREWTVIGRGRTARQAIDAAMIKTPNATAKPAERSEDRP